MRIKLLMVAFVDVSKGVQVNDLNATVLIDEIRYSYIFKILKFFLLVKLAGIYVLILNEFLVVTSLGLFFSLLDFMEIVILEYITFLLLNVKLKHDGVLELFHIPSQLLFFNHVYRDFLFA